MNLYALDLFSILIMSLPHKPKNVSWRRPLTSKVEIYEPLTPDPPKPTSLAPTGSARLTSNQERIKYYQSMDRFCIPRECIKRFANATMSEIMDCVTIHDDAIIYIHTEVEKFIVAYITAANIVTEHAKRKKIDVEDILIAINILQLLTTYSPREDEIDCPDDAEDTIGIPTPSMKRLTYKAGATFVTPKAANMLRVIAKNHFTIIFQSAIDNMIANSRKTITMDDFE